MDNYTVRLREVPTTKDLQKFMVTVPPQDLVDTLRQVAVHEIAQEATQGSKPSAIIVDGTTQGVIFAQRRIQAIYGDAGELAAAMHEAFDLMRRLTRFKTGRARASYRLVLNGHVVGDESAVDRVAVRMTSRDSAVIVGPLTIYGRKLYWNPITTGPRLRQKKYKRRDRSTRGRGATFTEPIGMAAARLVRRKYRTLTVREVWVATSIFAGIGADNRAPGVMVRYKAGRNVPSRFH